MLLRVAVHRESSSSVILCSEFSCSAVSPMLSRRRKSRKVSLHRESVYTICRRPTKTLCIMSMVMRILRTDPFPLETVHVHPPQIRSHRPGCLLEVWRTAITSIHLHCKASRREMCRAGRACPLRMGTLRHIITTLHRKTIRSLDHTDTSRARGCERLMTMGSTLFHSVFAILFPILLSLYPPLPQNLHTYYSIGTPV